MPAKPKTIDEYLARVPAERRHALASLRATIHASLPGLEECISYSMPAFRHEGHVVAGFLATSKGCSYFPFSGTTLATLADELRTYEQTKSALHFAPERPLPKALVKKLLKARVAETQSVASGATAPRAKRAGSSARRVMRGAVTGRPAKSKK